MSFNLCTITKAIYNKSNFDIVIRENVGNYKELQRQKELKIVRKRKRYPNK